MLQAGTFQSLLLGFLLTGLFQQSQESLVYIESWKKGTRQIQEQELTIELSLNYPKYQTKIRDTAGKSRYTLSVKPSTCNNTDSGIGSWVVKLDGGYFNRDLFRESKHSDPLQDYFTYEDAIGLICAVSDKTIMGEDAVATLPPAPPLLAKRVIKVEGFYCIIQVKEYGFIREKKGVFQSIMIQVQLKNSYDRPR